MARARWALSLVLVCACGDPLPAHPTPPAAEAPSATIPPCPEGARRCVGPVPERCDRGEWVATEACGPEQACFAGLCTPPSCRARARGAGLTCGVSPDDCCASPLVAGGTFFREYDGVDFASRTSPATLSDFRLDRYLVTVGRFRAFVEAGGGTLARLPATDDGSHPKIVASGWHWDWNGALASDSKTLEAALACDVEATWTHDAGPNEHLPINCITWFEALEFCAWDGGRLPTEAEYGYARSGGEEQRYYAWSPSNDVDATRAVYAGAPLDFVGSRPAGAGRWGQLDLAGEIEVWVLDVGVPDFWPTPCRDCAMIDFRGLRRVAGSSREVQADGLRSALRGGGVGQGVRRGTIGARCARQP